MIETLMFYARWGVENPLHDDRVIADSGDRARAALRTHISVELLAYLQDWLTWAENGALHLAPYSRKNGLCGNLRYWFSRDTWLAKEDELFRLLGNKVYPFVNEADFRRRQLSGTLHECRPLGVGSSPSEADCTMTLPIDWSRPLELEDGTPMTVVSNYNGRVTLKHTDGLPLTRDQTGKIGRGKRVVYDHNGHRPRRCGLSVRDVEPDNVFATGAGHTLILNLNLPGYHFPRFRLDGIQFEAHMIRIRAHHRDLSSERHAQIRDLALAGFYFGCRLQLYLGRGDYTATGRFHAFEAMSGSVEVLLTHVERVQ